MSHKNLYLNILKYSSSLYVLSLAIHYFNIKSIRFSELFFIVLIIICSYGIKKKFIKITLIKSDIIFSIFFITNIFLFIFHNFNLVGMIGLLFSLYLYLIYFIFRNIFVSIDYKVIIESIINLSIFSSIMGIIGFSLLQFDINNILATNTDNIAIIQNSYSIIIKPGLANALLATPALMAFMTIISLLFLIIFNQQKKYFKLNFLLLNLALFLTFSKSAVIYIGILILNFLKKKYLIVFKIILIFTATIFFITHSFLTNFLILDSNKEYEWLNDKFTDVSKSPIYKNNQIKIVRTNYFFLKEKSVNLIRNNFFSGIGYNQFSKNNSKYKHLKNQNPHSTYFGITTEFGLFGLISVLIIFYYAFHKSKEINNYIYLIVLYISLEAINSDILSLKIIWILFALISFMTNKEKLNN